ncbi:hypothetical protein DCAR_0518644 [Daucus carota subsp. sativus]|uniref:Uncharacterized protein n=1 Tax=Daucus carota subsp. sativus TaxID=79200 RepID=A0A161YIH2_DAUCS|nr:PREDICTED: deSI-like protein At4g17486 [Daucus carota subsp. sativus]WOG99296.1 hypothetical protein DCAR_0518644 [Daucus carota subsp. sativus]
MLCTRDRKRSQDGSFPVYLNVYDLTSVNGYAYWLGLGAYHSAVQVHGIEYAFGAHEYSTSGIFEGEPRKCQEFTFRKSVLIGWTEMNVEEVRRVMEEELAYIYTGTAYNLITKNCNHFCNDACVKLTGNPIPSWVNRLAKIGFYCNCIIPARLKTAKFGNDRSEAVCEEEETKLANPSNETSTTTSDSSSSSPSSSPATRNESTRMSLLALPPPPLFLPSP